ncbi:MAG: hypothetical protein ACRD44_16800, partial [Bryobacteraceae bacterium]
MKDAPPTVAKTTVVSLAQLLTAQPAAPPPGWIEPGLLPPQGILFVGGEPKVARVCWWPISRWRWCMAKTAPAS